MSSGAAVTVKYHRCVTCKPQKLSVAGKSKIKLPTHFVSGEDLLSGS